MCCAAWLTYKGGYIRILKCMTESQWTTKEIYCLKRLSYIRILRTRARTGWPAEWPESTRKSFTYLTCITRRMGTTERETAKTLEEKEIHPKG
jgi:hypothetical protein